MQVNRFWYEDGQLSCYESKHSRKIQTRWRDVFAYPRISECDAAAGEKTCATPRFVHLPELHQKDCLLRNHLKRAPPTERQASSAPLATEPDPPREA